MRVSRITRLGWTLLATLLLTACGHSRADEPAGTARSGAPADLAVTRGDLAVRVLLTGELVAENAAQLVAPNANIFPLTIRWLAEDGSEVAAGETVVEFDNAQLVSNLENLRVQVVSAANALASLRARTASDEAQAVFELEQSRGQLEKARLEAEASKLKAPIEREKKVLELQRAELELEKAVRKLESTRRSQQAEIEIQKIALQKARAEVARAEDGIDKLVLTAPRDGIVTVETNGREGRTYQVGDNVWPGQTIARMPEIASLIVEARLFDVDDHRIAPGMPVRATLDAFPDEVFTGTVREIDRIARDSDRMSTRRFFRTLVDLDRIDADRMRPGMSVKLELESSHADVLQAPRPGLDWSEGGARALVDGSWQPVTLGACNARACIVEAGLEEGVRLQAAADAL